uniref:Uncharacterized protein n=1 Tax=Anopheles culicifacies TaxID=139723 RepID=A0A182MUH0_9DIPT
MDKLSTASPATVGSVCGVTDVKFSRPLPSSSFSIENLIAVKRRRSPVGSSSPEIDPVDQGSCSPPAPRGSNAAGGLLLEASQQQQQQQQYLAAAAAGYSAAMLSFSSFPPLYHPWGATIPAAGRYLSQAANEKLSTLLLHHSSGGHKSYPGGEPCAGAFSANEAHQPSVGMSLPGAASPRGTRSGDKLFPTEADLLSKVYAVYQHQHHHHQQTRYHANASGSPGAGNYSGPLESNVPNGMAPVGSAHSLVEQPCGGSGAMGADGGVLEDEERTRPMEDGGESADGSAYSDDISLTLSPSGCGKTTGKLLMMGL